MVRSSGRPFVVGKIWPCCLALIPKKLQGLWESEYEVTISRSEMSLKSAMLNADECALLGVEPGSMGIHLQQVHYDQHGQPFSINTEDWRNDVVEFSISVNY